jgi:hypothetical protein
MHGTLVAMRDDNHQLGQLLGQNQPDVAERSAAAWQRVSDELPLTTLERKAVYVAGLIRHLAESAGLCLEVNRHLPAFLLTMGAVETLGADAVGGARGPHQVAADGLAFIAEVPRKDKNQVVASTAQGQYTVRNCLDRRDFTAHGGAGLTSGIVLDEMLTVRLLCLLVAGLDRWWASLKGQVGVQRLLAVSKVVPLATNNSVVFVDDPWRALVDGASPAGELQHESWRSHC